MSGPAYTRADFDRCREAVNAVSRRAGRPLLVASVGLGVAQLLLIRWLDAHVDRPVGLPIEGTLFLVYMALVGWLIWRLQRSVRAVRPTCPNCGVILQGMSERVAAATGRCDACGGQVIAGDRFPA